MTERVIHPIEGMRIEFGKFKGTLWTRVPVEYLKWLANKGAPDGRALAITEMERRGIDINGDIFISTHAVNRASLKLFGKYRKLRLHENEGLHSWLCRMTVWAIKNGKKLTETTYEYNGMIFIVDNFCPFPTLKTIYEADKPDLTGQ